MPAWLKAGLIGAAILVVLTLINLIPIPAISCFTLPLNFLAYIAAGALAASYLPPIRGAGQGAGQGALAGLVASAIGGLALVVITMIQSSLINYNDVMSTIPPETLQQLQDAGIDPSLLVGPATGIVGGLICCSIGILFGLALGAIGGAIYAAVKPS